MTGPAPGVTCCDAVIDDSCRYVRAHREDYHASLCFISVIVEQVSGRRGAKGGLFSLTNFLANGLPQRDSYTVVELPEIGVSVIYFRFPQLKGVKIRYIGYLEAVSIVQ